jgi:hypothetical protein
MAGSVLPDGIGPAALGDELITEVGVGTGIRVTAGGEAGTDGVAVLRRALGVALGTDSSTATRFGPRGAQSAIDSVTEVVAVVGAEPMPPAPAGSLIDGGAGVGAPTAQPTATEKGSPSATMLTKMDLGVRRMP